jgi:hypothetical protein
VTGHGEIDVEAHQKAEQLRDRRVVDLGERSSSSAAATKTYAAAIMTARTDQSSLTSKPVSANAHRPHAANPTSMAAFVLPVSPAVTTHQVDGADTGEQGDESVRQAATDAGR